MLSSLKDYMSSIEAGRKARPEMYVLGARMGWNLPNSQDCVGGNIPMNLFRIKSNRKRASSSVQRL
jgi:hypothetical protein